MGFIFMPRSILYKRTLGLADHQNVSVMSQGDLVDSCLAAGGHFNPFGMAHGAPADDVGGIKVD